MTIDINELREAIQTFGSQAINEDDLNELINRLEVAESARRDVYQNWMTALDRNAELLAKLEAAEKEVESIRQGITFRDDVVAALAMERDALRTKIADMEQQEPVAWMSSRNGFICKENKNPEYNVPLKRFDLGAQTQGEEK